MAIRYVVEAEVVDVESDQPRPTDRLLVDTNIWFWMTYSGAGRRESRETRIYPGFVKRARRAKAKLYRCGLSAAELAHRIESTEYEIYKQTHGRENLKEFRTNPTERKEIVDHIENAWRLVKFYASPVQLLIDEAVTDSAVQRLATQTLDGYDLFMAEAASAAGFTQVLTDDGDYCTVPGIELFTANRKVLEAAQQQGKLRIR